MTTLEQSSLVPARWNKTVEAFVADGGAVDIEDGGFSVHLGYSTQQLAQLLADAPVRFRESSSDSIDITDQYGQGVGEEASWGLATADTAMALVTWHDHFQAGLSARLQVFTSSAAYHHAVAKAEEDMSY